MKLERNARVRAAMVMAATLAGLIFLAESPAASLTLFNSGLPDYATNPVAISADGSTVAGTLDEGGPTSYAFIWTAAEGMHTIGSLGEWHSDAYDISADGTTIVGSSQVDSDGKYYPFKWTAGGGMVNLGSLGGFNSAAYGVSADGSVIVGVDRGILYDNCVPLRWTQAGGMQTIGTSGTATGVSDDGTAVLVVDYYEMKTYRWTAASGMVDIGTLGGNYCWESHISGDGKTIIGTADNSSGENCLFRWTEETGIVNLTPTGSFDGQIGGVSADCSVIVGAINNAAYIWTQATGILDLRSVLESQGVDVDGWELGRAVDVTVLPDGSLAVIGLGGNSTWSGAFYATLAMPVPEPATIALFAAGGIALLRRNKK